RAAKERSIHSWSRCACDGPRERTSPPSSTIPCTQPPCRDRRAGSRQTGRGGWRPRSRGGRSWWSRARAETPPGTGRGRGGAAVAREAEQLWRKAEPVQHVQMWCQARIVALPAPKASPAVPFVLRRAFENAIALFRDPAAIETRIRVGPLSLVGVPGEPVGELGRRMSPDVLVGLADGY